MKIGNQEYKEIIIMTDDADRELIASITDNDVITKDGYRVECVPQDD